MFTTKPEAGEKITKLGGGVGDAKTPFTERPATYASKSPGPSASKMVPSIIGEDLTIRGNVTSKGEVQVDGEIEGDIRCGSLLLGDRSRVTGGVAAEDIVVRGHLVGSIRGLRITLQAQSHVEGDIFHESLAVEQGAYFEGKSLRSDNPLAEIKAPGANGSANSGPIPRVHRAWRLPSRRSSEGLSKDVGFEACFRSRRPRSVHKWSDQHSACASSSGGMSSESAVTSSVCGALRRGHTLVTRLGVVFSARS
jgi:cytoskeletal protein CcmA (bactofilin family)